MKAWDDRERDQSYWDGIGKAPFAKRTYYFILKYQVLHPYQAYTLEFDRGQVTGENAVVLWDKYRAVRSRWWSALC